MILPPVLSGGEIGWLSKGSDDYKWEEPVLQGIFSLPGEGDISPVITTETGHYIVRLIERRPKTVKPLAQVDKDIKRRLLNERRETVRREFYGNLKRSVRIEQDPDLLKTIEVPLGAKARKLKEGPPALPSG